MTILYVLVFALIATDDAARLNVADVWTSFQARESDSPSSSTSNALLQLASNGTALPLLAKTVVNLIHTFEDAGTDAFHQEIYSSWEKIDPRLWLPKYLCFYHLQMVLWIMSQSKTITDFDTCSGRIGKELNLKDKLIFFARAARHLASRMHKSLKSKQKKDERWSVALVKEASNTIHIIDNVVECFKDATRRVTVNGVVSCADDACERADETSRIFAKYLKDRMLDAVAVDFGLSHRAKLPGKCSDENGETSQTDWARGAWRVVCLTEAARRLMSAVCDKTFTVSSIVGTAWMPGGILGYDRYMKITGGEALHTFPKHRIWSSSPYFPAWKLKCTDGYAEKVSLDDGNTWFASSGSMRPIYVADFSDETDAERQDMPSSWMNAYIEKLP